MKRGLAFVVFAVLASVPASAFAQASEPEPSAEPPAEPQAAPPPAPPATTRARPAETSELLIPTPVEWKAQYDDARSKLATGDFEGAAARFGALEASAVNRVDRALAREQRTLAMEWAKRNLAFVHRSDANENASAKAVDRRSSDEIAVLYTNASVYGLGSGVWVGTLTKPESPASAILPALALTGGSVGTVIALDGGRGLRYGVAQSIATGLWIGVEQGIAWTAFAYEENSGARNLAAKEASSIVWGFSTAGAVAGGILGSALGTTPGRSGWVGSTSLWTGTIAAFAVGALKDENRGDAAPWAALGVGSAAGTILGLATASSVSPSIARVRIIDFAGGVGGGLSGAGLYLAAAGNKPDSQAAAGVAALGMTAGLITTYLATSSMAEDRLRTEAKGDDESKARKSARVTDAMRPMLMPANGGAMIGFGGLLQ